MVTFIIGAESVKQNFLVHKHLASAHSPFFKAAFESPMVEGTMQTMRLEDVEVETFGVLVHWMYTGEFKAGLRAFTNDKDDTDYDLTAVAKVWKLAQRLLMPRLQNSAMEEIFKNRRVSSDDSIIKLAKFIFRSRETVDKNLALFITLFIALEMGFTRYQRLAYRLPHILVVDISGALCRLYTTYPSKQVGDVKLKRFLESIDSTNEVWSTRRSNRRS